MDYMCTTLTSKVHASFRHNVAHRTKPPNAHNDHTALRSILPDIAHCTTPLTPLHQIPKRCRLSTVQMRHMDTTWLLWTVSASSSGCHVSQETLTHPGMCLAASATSTCHIDPPDRSRPPLPAPVIGSPRGHLFKLLYGIYGPHIAGLARPHQVLHNNIHHMDTPWPGSTIPVSLERYTCHIEPMWQVWNVPVSLSRAAASITRAPPGQFQPFLSASGSVQIGSAGYRTRSR